MADSDELVCSECGETSCWNGVLMCEDAYRAGVVSREEYDWGVKQVTGA